MPRLWRRFITYPVLAAVGVAMAVEESFWRLGALLAFVGRIPLIRAGEAWLRTLPPAGAVLVFGAPAVALAPVKILALYWLAGGHPALGIGAIMTAKVLGTAIVSRLFHVMRDQLLVLRWFRWGYLLILRLREAAYRWWSNTAVGRWWRVERDRRKNWLRRRWEASRAWWTRKWYLARFGKLS